MGASPGAGQCGIAADLHRKLLEVSPVPIAVIEPDTTVRLWNQAAERLFGWTAEEVVGRPIPIVPSDEGDELRDARDAIVRGESLAGLETYGRRKDGTRVDVALSASPLHDADGRVALVMLVFQDLSERRRTEEQGALARREAESAQARLGFLADASVVLASSLDYTTTLDHVARLAVPALGDYCVIDVGTSPGDMRRVAAAHADPAKDRLVQRLRELPPTPGMMERMRRVIATGEPDVVASLDLERAAEAITDPARRELLRALGPRSYIVVAVQARGATLGTMTFVSADPGRRYRRPDVDLAQELARRAAVALENAKLHESERRARAQAEAAERRAAFLAEVSAVLASSLDYDTTLRAVADLAVPFVADWCSVDVVDPDGTVRRLALAHADPAKADIARAARTYPPDPEGRHPRTYVLRTGQSLLIPTVPEAALAEIASSEEHRQALQALGYRSAMFVPLRVRGTTIGAITFATAESARTYDHDDLALAEELARRAAVAIDNARLFDAERRARAAAQAASRTKDEFLSTVSHELRTPLQAILGWVALLRQGKLSEAKAARAIDIIERSGRAQARLIGDLLDVSRMVTGRLHLELRPVTLPPVVQAAIDAVQPAADVKRVRVRCLVDPGVGPVAGDPDRLQQIVWNLLSNAVKFTPSGGRVDLVLERADNEIQIVVSDTGSGIAPEFLPHVFERFRQAEDVRSTKRQSGLGLGLAIVRHLVELHGGRVTVNSPGVGLGATFTVMLPAAPLAQPHPLELPADARPSSDSRDATHPHR
jgi:PAS domain S-box-containing protein